MSVAILTIGRDKGTYPLDNQVLIPLLGIAIGIGLMGSFCILKDLSPTNVGIGMLVGFLVGYHINRKLRERDRSKEEKTSE